MSSVSTPVLFRTSLSQDPNVTKLQRKLALGILIVFFLLIPILYKIISFEIYNKDNTPAAYVFVNMASFVIGLLALFFVWKGVILTSGLPFITYTFIFNIGSIFVQVLLMIFNLNHTLGDTGFNILINVIISALAFITALLIIWKNKVIRRQWNVLRKENILTTLAVIILAVAVMFFLNYLSAQIKSSTSDNQDTINDLKNSGTLGLIGMFFTVIISAPLIEELCYREGLIHISGNKLVGSIISLIMFIFIHIQFNKDTGQSDLASVINYLPGALVLVSVYYLRDNYVYGWGVHLAINGIGFIVPLLTK